MLVIPRTKQMASRMLDLPLPLSPVMELKLSSLRPASHQRLLDHSHATAHLMNRYYYHPDITVRTAYDLKPC
jgi:hypothetical protein